MLQTPQFPWQVSPVESADQHVTGEAHPPPELQAVVAQFPDQAAAL